MSHWACCLEREVKLGQAWKQWAETSFGWDFHLPIAQWCPVGRAEMVLGLLWLCPGASHPAGTLPTGREMWLGA